MEEMGRSRFSHTAWLLLRGGELVARRLFLAHEALEDAARRLVGAGEWEIGEWHVARVGAAQTLLRLDDRLVLVERDLDHRVVELVVLPVAEAQGGVVDQK